MKIRNTLIVLLAMFGLSGIALADQASYEAALSQAQAAADKAEKAGDAWTTTDDLIKSAQEAAKGGDFTKAEALAKEAQADAERAMQQGEEQKNAGPM